MRNFGIKETVIQVDYQELDDLINEYFELEKEEGAYHQAYEFVGEHEANNYSSYEFNIDGILSEYNQKFIDKVIKYKKSSSYDTCALLNYLAKIGEIETGKYIISVYW